MFDALRDHLSDEEILELAYIVGTYAMHGALSRALRLEYDAEPRVLAEEPGDEESLSADYTRDELRRIFRVVDPTDGS